MSGITPTATEFILLFSMFVSERTAIRELRALSTKPFAVPGEAGFPLGGLFPAPANKTESGMLFHVSRVISSIFSFVNFFLFSFFLCGTDLFRTYFKQAREELAVRLCERVFDADGSKNKWWQVRLLLLFMVMFGFNL